MSKLKQFVGNGTTDFIALISHAPRAAACALLLIGISLTASCGFITNGDAGHQTMHGNELAKRRLAEAKESARRQGIEQRPDDIHRKRKHDRGVLVSADYGQGLEVA